MHAVASTWTLPTPDSTQSKVSLIPYPVEVNWQHQDTAVHGPIKISTPYQSDDAGSGHLSNHIAQIFKESRVPSSAKTPAAHYHIQLIEGNVSEARISNEAYTLETKPNGVTITARHPHGFFNGLQTFRQLLYHNGDSLMVAGCKIRDWPAFQTRGVMLDVGRNYMSPDFIKQQVDRLARYKINVLHLHFTEDAAWRLQIKQHPQLTQAKFHWPTRQPGKHYTHEEIRDLVAYCQARHISVIPEIDMPGHSEAFRHAMGVDMQSPEGIRILKEVIDEVVSLFPAKSIHLGSDEVKIRMPEFMPTMVDYVRSLGKQVIVWSPGNQPAKKVINMHWGDHNGHQVDPEMKHLSTIGFYMDWIDSQSGVYQYFFQQPCDVPYGNQNAMGAVTCVWTDGALSNEKRVLTQYPFYPCSLTFAERIWRGAHQARPDLYAKLPQPGTPAYNAFAEFETRLTDHRDKFFKDLPFAYVKQSHIPWRLIGPFDHHGVNDRSFGPEQAIQDSYRDGNRTLTWEHQPAWGSAIHLRHHYSVFNLHQNQVAPDYWPATMNHRVGKGGGTCYALQYIHSPQSQSIHLMFGIGGQWGHSGGYRTARAPSQGSWDFSGGDLWLNDQRVTPPHWPFKSLPWSGWRKGRIEHAPLTEEGYFFRPPVPVTLQQGWNKILVRIPFGWWKEDKGQRKWFFNCVPVSWDGTHYREVDQLQYATTQDHTPNPPQSK
ncbi:family 20 glycosylhydrolase [Verrucomicrobiaceae bacterium N1E253]|uniref:beta-N-acetylhexosaminidase n=2 Tax=Oceaniferula marina TaxID=2748318 RepID=A0A851GF95_9BACT|nr:family 20 glycosylhydrolase [Oceaniferula marina]